MNDNNQRPECYDSVCEAEAGTTGITSCIHCGGELRQVGPFWYHWSQFDHNDELFEGTEIQDTVK